MWIICKRCKEEKPSESFRFDSRGYQHWICKHCAIKQQSDWAKRNPLRTGGNSAKSRMGRKLKALDLLGGKCVVCGYKNPLALCFDHINGDGYLSSKSARSGSVPLILRLGDNAKYSFQILCCNCNMIKKLKNGEYGIGRKNFHKSRILIIKESKSC